MKKCLLCILVILFLRNAYGQNKAIPVYYTPVSMPAFLKTAYYGLFDPKLLAEDLADLLGKATGKSFTPVVYTKEAVSGIFLILDSSKRSIGNETGILETDGKSFIRVTAGYTTGISYTMYSWLEETGFRFYLPGDEWMIIPSLHSVFSSVAGKKIYKPYFHMRMFSSSGGNPAVKGLDENRQNAKSWQQWYIRNRMGCDYISIGGHAAEAFNITHKEEIENDSLIVAPTNGKRRYANSSKLDPTYKKGVDLFSNWIADEAIKDNAAYPAFLPFRKYYTADLGDGLGYCHTPDCEKEFNSVSDQAFSIVNEAAKKVKARDPRAGVSTLAYSERADTPSINIEKNVHVMVVTSAFQDVGTPVELIKRWTKKSGNVSVYDYLNISSWRQDNPFSNIDRYFSNLLFLKSLHVEGITFETSLSKFASGIQQYFILKFLCNPYTSIDNELDLFCKDNFGDAAAPIKKLFKEWYFSDVHSYTNFDYPCFYEDELGRFIQYISEADNIPSLSGAIKKRINELKAYCVYLCKYYELFAELKSVQDSKRDTTLRNKQLEDILTYTWQLYTTNIFHNTQLNDVLKRALSDKQKEKWNYSISDQFKNLKVDISVLVKNEFEKTAKKYLALAVPLYAITDSFLEANTKYTADSIRMVTIDETSLNNFLYPIDFFCASPGILKVNYETGKSLSKNKTNKVAMVSVESQDYKFIKTNFIYKENSRGSISYNIPVKGHYRLYLSQYNATHISYIIYPGKNLFYHNKKSLLMSGLMMQDQSGQNPYPNKYLAFYAPPVDSIYFKNIYLDSKNTSRLYSATGVPMLVKENKDQFYNSASIPKNESPPFIFYENSHFRWSPVLYNTAPYYFFLKYPIK